MDTRQNPSISTKSLVSLDKLVLENNVFEFYGKVYRQKLGTAIVTKFKKVMNHSSLQNMVSGMNALEILLELFN